MDPCGLSQIVNLNEIGTLLTVLNVLTFCNFSVIKLLIWCAAH